MRQFILQSGRGLVLLVGGCLAAHLDHVLAVGAESSEMISGAARAHPQEDRSPAPRSGKNMDEDEELRAANARYMKDQLEAETRLRRFQEEVKKAPDPVALAIPLAKDRFLFCARAAMDLLLDHWNDARAEQTLADIAQGEPKFLRDGLKTAAGEAHIRLLKLRAKKEFQGLLKDAKTPRDQWLQIKALFEKNPEWLSPVKPLTEEKAALLPLLFETAKVAGGADAVPLLLQSGSLSAGDPYLAKNSEAVFEYISRLGPEKTLASPVNLLDYLVASRHQGAGGLLEAWLKLVKEESHLKALVTRVAYLPDGKQRLIKLLDDTRPAVVTKAASWLEHSYPSPDSLKAVRDAIQRRKKAGATEREIEYLQAVAAEIEEALNSKGK